MARGKTNAKICITPERNELLKVLNQQTKVPFAEPIRQSLDLILDKYLP